MERSASAALIAEIEAELAVVQPAAPPALDAVMPAVRSLLDTDMTLLFTPSEGLHGLQMTRYHTAGFRDPAALRERATGLWRKSPVRYGWYNPIRPEPEQRNRVLEATELMAPGELDESSVCREVWRPLGLHACWQPRVLLCEGASLLAWFGSFHSGPPPARLFRMLRRLATPIRRRLLVERHLDSAMHGALLAAALEHVGAPAFVLGKQGRILEANTAARALLESRRDDVRAAFTAPCGAGGLQIELVPLREQGTADVQVAIVRSGDRDARIASSIGAAAARWQLSPRQADILTRLVQGDPSVTIAADLGLSVRSVELQISALFDRTQTATRAELVAAALLS